MVVLYQNGISKAKLAVPMLSMFMYAAQGCYWRSMYTDRQI